VALATRATDALNYVPLLPEGEAGLPLLPEEGWHRR
jgi:hypothetical protein